jgi:predicted DNA-binding protein YlxM (UPF0122 family)
MTPKELLTREFLEEHYIKRRKSVAVIAEEFGLKSHNSVTQALERFGLSRSSNKDSSHLLTKEFLIENYVNQNKSLKTIAEQIGFKRKSIVKKALIKHGIEVREHTISEKMKLFHKNSRNHKHIAGNYFYSVKTSALLRNIEFEITKDDIWEVFQSQSGLCKYTGIELNIGRDCKRKTCRTASVDRIDNEKGYTRDNIQIVHKSINQMKWDRTEEEFIRLCRLVSEHTKDLYP